MADARAKGGAVVVGGGRPEDLPAELAGGHFFAPTLITGATADMRVFREETFGPLVPVFKFQTEDEAIALANTTVCAPPSFYFFAPPLLRPPLSLCLPLSWQPPPRCVSCAPRCPSLKSSLLPPQPLNPNP